MESPLFLGLCALFLLFPRGISRFVVLMLVLVVCMGTMKYKRSKKKTEGYKKRGKQFEIVEMRFSERG